MDESNVQVLPTFGDTLTFSEEEWLGLASWQKELYRTVMRDTAELFHSLGFMYSVKEELELRDGWAAHESAEESLENQESAIIEEISGENFIIQITEMSVVKQEEDNTVRTAIPFPPHPSQTSTNQETLFSHNSVLIPRHSAKAIGEGNETFTSLESSEDGLVYRDAETSTTLESPEDGLVSLGNETSIFTSLKGSHVAERANFIKTEDMSDVLEDTNRSCAPGPFLYDPTAVLPIGNEGQTRSSVLFSETDFLTVIQVEDANDGSVGDPSTIQTGLWDIRSDCTKILWNGRMESPNPQSEAVFPVALVIPHNTIIARPSRIDQGTLIVDTPQWCEQVPVCQQDDGKDDRLARRAEWTNQHNPGGPLVEKSFQCSICKKSFLYIQHLKNHEKIHNEDKSLKKPPCDVRATSKTYLSGSQESHPISSHNDHVMSTDESLQPSKLFSCTECGRTFSYLFQFNRHQKIHARDKLLLRPVAPPPKKVYKLPQFLPTSSREVDTKLDSIGDSCRKLHQHLQLSTAFLQNLLTSTCGFQYD